MQLITLIPVCALLSGALAQINYAAYTDDKGIEFWNAELSTDVGTGDAQFGLVLPPVDADDLSDEYIGRMVVPIPEPGTWFGITHKSGMTGNLILMAWPNGDEVVTDFRYATGYTSPASYTGNATLTQISSSVNESYFEITYRCEHCWVWDQEGTDGSQIPGTAETSRQIMGWAQAAKAPSTPEDSDSAITQHASANMFYMVAASARNDAYTDYAAMATGSGSETEAPVPTATSGSNSTTSAIPEATAVATGAACPTGGNMNASQTYDYIIVGSGAGGIPAAAKLAESGKKVLLIERGPASSGRHGGTMKPDWLSGTNLTRFDVPGLDNEIWVNSEGIACTDYSVMAGCVLGGGTAVNAGLWWNPDPLDFDEGFPEGWKHADIEPAITRAFEKIPFNDRPSKDGELYKAQGYNIVGTCGSSMMCYGGDQLLTLHSWCS
jgi:cellobiose dehydrogenase (acceptor)